MYKASRVVSSKTYIFDKLTLKSNRCHPYLNYPNPFQLPINKTKKELENRKLALTEETLTRRVLCGHLLQFEIRLAS